MRALLRRLKRAAPDIRSVAWCGAHAEDAAAALPEEGLEPAESGKADAEVHWVENGIPENAGSSARAIVIVARRNAFAPLPVLLHQKSAVRYLPLRDWVRGWFPSGSALGETAARLLVSPAVGDRPCRVRLPGWQEGIYVREGARVSRSFLSGCNFAFVTFCGVGLFPLMPATLASALLVPPALAVYYLGGQQAFFFTAIFVAVAATVLGVLLEKWAMRWFLSDDPREFVLDEVAGMALAWAMLPANAGWPGILLAFFLFRIFDIFKWGVHWVEGLPVAGKIVWDDLLAGLYAGLLSWAAVSGWNFLLR